VVRFPAGARDLSLLQNVHTCSGAHFYTGLKRPGLKGNHTPRSTSDVKNSPSSVPPLPNTPSRHTAKSSKSKSKGVPRQAEVALGVPGWLRPRIFSTFGTTRVVGRQPNAPTAFIPREIPDTHFRRLSLPQGTWFCQKEPRKKKYPGIPPGIDPGTVRLVAERLNQYITPGPHYKIKYLIIFTMIIINYFHVLYRKVSRRTI
jgi:hypothetical protein